MCLKELYFGGGRQVVNKYRYTYGTGRSCEENYTVENG